MYAVNRYIKMILSNLAKLEVYVHVHMPGTSAICLTGQNTQLPPSGHFASRSPPGTSPRCAIVTICPGKQKQAIGLDCYYQLYPLSAISCIYRYPIVAISLYPSRSTEAFDGFDSPIEAVGFDRRGIGGVAVDAVVTLASFLGLP